MLYPYHNKTYFPIRLIKLTSLGTAQSAIIYPILFTAILSSQTETEEVVLGLGHYSDDWLHSVAIRHLRKRKKKSLKLRRAVPLRLRLRRSQIGRTQLAWRAAWTDLSASRRVYGSACASNLMVASCSCWDEADFTCSIITGSCCWSDWRVLTHGPKKKPTKTRKKADKRIALIILMLGSKVNLISNISVHIFQLNTAAC